MKGRCFMSKHTRLNLDGVDNKYYKTNNNTIIEVALDNYYHFYNFREIDEAFSCVIDTRLDSVPTADIHYLVLKDIADNGTPEQKLELAKKLALADFCENEFDVERHEGVVSNEDYRRIKHIFGEDKAKEFGIEVGKEAEFAIAVFHNPYGTHDYFIYENSLTDIEIYENLLMVENCYIMGTLFAEGHKGYLECGWAFEESVNNIDVSEYEYYDYHVEGYEWESNLILLPSGVHSTKDTYGILDFESFMDNVSHAYRTWTENDIGSASEYNIEDVLGDIDDKKEIDPLVENYVVLCKEDIEDCFGSLEYIGEFHDIDDCVDYLTEQSLLSVKDNNQEQSLGEQIKSANDEKKVPPTQPSHQDPIL